jgi:DNA-binding transcriptional MerR regulator/methylmalonyl-CoA mutase cobalamin-binding subunit
MSFHTEDETPKHPIGVVSTRTGIAPDLLRAWERRYGAVRPHRMPSGRRLYCDRDVKRLALLRGLVAAGRRISDVAGLELAELESLAREDRAARPGGTTDRAPRGPGGESAGHLEDALEAVGRLDASALERVLADAALGLSPPKMRKRVILPLLKEIGERWRGGSLRVVHEHIASLVVRRFLDGMRSAPDSGGRPKLAVTTPSGQLHEFGALMAAAAAEEVGWEAVYLGPSLPAEEIASGARTLEAGVVALSIVKTGDHQLLERELRALRRYLGPDVAILAGGAAAPALAPVLEAVNGNLAEELGEFQAQLEALAERPAAGASPQERQSRARPRRRRRN